MSTEDKLVGARNGLAFSFAYMNIVGQEIGMEKAMAISGQVDEMMGREQGKLMKEQIGGKEVDIETAAEMALDAIKEGFGIKSKVVQKSADRLVVRCSRCPVYEAAQSLGMDADTIEDLCRTGSLKFMDAMVKELNPNLSYNLTKFRTHPNSSCEEELRLG